VLLLDVAEEPEVDVKQQRVVAFEHGVGEFVVIIVVVGGRGGSQQVHLGAKSAVVDVQKFNAAPLAASSLHFVLVLARICKVLSCTFAVPSPLLCLALTAHCTDEY